MGMRIRVLLGCLAIGATAVILTGTAAHATSLGGTPTVGVTSSKPAPGNCNCCQGDNNYGDNNNCCQGDNNYGDNNNCCQGDNNYGYQTCRPAPKPTCTCQETTPPTIPPTTVTSAPVTSAPVPQVTSTKPVTPTSSAPSVAPVTGGGGSIGGGDGPLAAGGVAIALAAGLIGTFAYRRWRRTRSPAA